MHINPDFHLQTANGRIFSVERNRLAWEKCLEQLTEALNQSTAKTLYIMVGCQASGKTTWAKQHAITDKNAIIFDALLILKIERKILIMLAKKHHLECIAVWIDTALDTCIRLNQARPEDERINQSGIINVYNLLMPPKHSEGFDSILRLSFDEQTKTYKTIC